MTIQTTTTQTATTQTATNRAVQDIYPLSPTQQGLLFHSLYGESQTGAYIVQVSFTLKGELNRVAFEQAWQQLMSRHTILRTAFVWDNLAAPVQVVGQKASLPICWHDWEDLAVAKQKANLTALIESDRIHDPYTLATAKRDVEPLIEAGIDTLVYGCTHYPHLAPVLAQFLPEHITLVDPALHLTAAAGKELEILGLNHHAETHATAEQRTEFYVSGDPEQFASVSQQWLGYKPVVKQVSVEMLESVHAASLPSAQVRDR